ncbi:ABC transporter substrate-binding protein [Rhodococcus daqingensis]|uniref:ABC transporter substrate-binding protein n=1 Tax=Rhodococcus daqingensis TaxID=2479363 RepID=A0ABW2RRA1_9NOCA
MPERFPRTAPARRLRVAAAVIAVAVAFASACSSDPAEPTGSGGGGDGTFPVTVASGPSGAATEVTIDARPGAVVSLSPSATETLWAVGAGEQVVAVDDQSDHPPGVPTTALSGYSPNVEAIIGYTPDLVIAMDDVGGLVSGLRAAGVPTLLLPAAADLDEAYAQIERIGAATGHLPEATALVASMRTEVDAAVAAVPERAGPLRYFHELDDTLYTVSDDSFLGEVYGLFGLASIADGGEAYPQLSAEYVVEADPDLIFLADGQCCGVTPERVAARPGWAGMTAVRAGQVRVLDADVASRWGPRVVDLVRDIGAAVATVPAPVG